MIMRLCEQLLLNQLPVSRMNNNNNNDDFFLIFSLLFFFVSSLHNIATLSGSPKLPYNDRYNREIFILSKKFINK